MTRLILRNAELNLGKMLIPKQVAWHARVTRVAPGEALELVNLKGVIARGRLLSWLGNGDCEVEVEELVHERGEPPFPLVLAVGVLHTSAFDWTVEKATELGATAVVPLLTTRVQGKDHYRRVLRWVRVAEAAVTQCGRCRPPEIFAPIALPEFLAKTKGLLVVADPQGWESGERGALDEDVFSRPLPLVSQRELPQGVRVVVGPEGGLTFEERDALKRVGGVSLTLGPRTLRAETAAIVALALVQARLGWWASQEKSS